MNQNNVIKMERLNDGQRDSKVQSLDSWSIVDGTRQDTITWEKKWKKLQKIECEIESKRH